jgi:hypothetical protein
MRLRLVALVGLGAVVACARAPTYVAGSPTSSPASVALPAPISGAQMLDVTFSGDVSGAYKGHVTCEPGGYGILTFDIQHPPSILFHGSGVIELQFTYETDRVLSGASAGSPQPNTPPGIATVNIGVTYSSTETATYMTAADGALHDHVRSNSSAKAQGEFVADLSPEPASSGSYGPPTVQVRGAFSC